MIMDGHTEHNSTGPSLTKAVTTTMAGAATQQQAGRVNSYSESNKLQTRREVANNDLSP